MHSPPQASRRLGELSSAWPLPSQCPHPTCLPVTLVASLGHLPPSREKRGLFSARGHLLLLPFLSAAPSPVNAPTAPIALPEGPAGQTPPEVGSAGRAWMAALSLPSPGSLRPDSILPAQPAPRPVPLPMRRAVVGHEPALKLRKGCAQRSPQETAVSGPCRARPIRNSCWPWGDWRVEGTHPTAGEAIWRDPGSHLPVL